MSAYFALAPLVPLLLAAAAPQDSAKPIAISDTKPAAASASDSAIPLEAFAKLPFMVGPTVSPDGTKIAARISVNGVQRLAILPLLPDAKPALVGLGDIDLNDWSWVNDDWLVARIGTTQPVEADKWYLRRAFGIKADGTKLVPLGKDAGQTGDDILWIAHDGTPRILLSLQTSIYADNEGFWPVVREYDVSTGKARRVVAPNAGVMDWYADGSGVVRLGMSYQDASRNYRVLYRDTAGQSFRTVDKARGRNASLGEVPALYLADPGKAVAFSDDDGFQALYDFDLTAMKIGKKVFGAPGYDISNIISDATSSRLIGVRYTDTQARTHWIDPVMAGIQADIDKAVGTARARIISWNRDFSVLVVHVGSDDRPGAFYVYRTAIGVMQFYASVNTMLAARHFGPVSTIRYTARDGLDMSAVVTLPRGKIAKNLPLILMPHGGPAARDDESWDWWAQFLASRGYAVVQPNYRGSTGFGTAFRDKGKGQWGLAMQDDLTDAVAWATKSGLADPKRVCIVGGSYGGYAALRAAQRDTGTYRCAVSFGGVADMPAMLRYDGNFLNGGRTKDYFRGLAPDLKSVSPINFARDFAIPVLLVHGKEDKVVPVGQSREMAERLKAAGKPFRYVEQREGDHFFTREADRVQFLKELETFLNENNPA